MESEPGKDVRGIAEGRRAFLKKSATLAVVTPPAMSLLLSTTMNSDAVASSGGKVFPGKGKKKVFPGKKTVFPGKGKG